MNKAFFLDRDGIINKVILKRNKPYPPRHINQFKYNDDLQEILKYIKAKGYIIIIVTNQPDPIRGICDFQDVRDIHNKIINEIEVDKIYSCFHTKNDECLCRKPKPGMIFQAAYEFKIDLKQSYLIGDRWKDIEAGNSAGCKTIFVDYCYKESKERKIQYDYKIDYYRVNERRSV